MGKLYFLPICIRENDYTGRRIEDGGAAALALAASAATVDAPFAVGFGLAVGIGLLWHGVCQDSW